jgi:hypothetical protein
MVAFSYKFVTPSAPLKLGGTANVQAGAVSVWMVT